MRQKCGQVCGSTIKSNLYVRARQHGKEQFLSVASGSPGQSYVWALREASAPNGRPKAAGVRAGFLLRPWVGGCAGDFLATFRRSVARNLPVHQPARSGVLTLRLRPLKRVTQVSKLARDRVAGPVALARHP